MSSSFDKPTNKPKRNTLSINPNASDDATNNETPTWRAPVRGRHTPRNRIALPGMLDKNASTETNAGPTISTRVRPERPRYPAADQSERGETGGRGRSSGRAGYSERDKSPAAPHSAPHTAPHSAHHTTPHPSNPRRREISEASRSVESEQTTARPTYKRTLGYQFFASCPRGLEEELCKELHDLGATDIVPASGGVGFVGDMPTGWKINLWSRLAIRVLWRVGEGHYKKEEDLYQAALALDWPSWFDVTRTIAVTTVGKHSPLPSLNFVSLRIKDAICDRFRAAVNERPSVNTRKPDIPLTLFLSSDRYTLYLDLSGEPLNRRGYRAQPSGAPLNENLAAGMLLLSGWTPGTPLFDPMMGGGTLLLEAAMMSLNIAPGLRRHFAFENLKTFDRIEWLRLHKNAEAAVLPREALPLFGSDIDPAMVRAAGLNLRAAGLFDCVRLMEADFLNVDPPTERGFIVSNPPYGVRMGSEEDLGPFYKEMGDNLKQHFPGWTVYLLSADPEMPKRIGLQTTRRIPLYNGPLECRLLEYHLVAGSNRKV